MPLPLLYGNTKPLPNVNSAHRTPASLMVDLHYARLCLVERWDWTRFVRLANFLQITPWELASLAMIRHDALDGYKLRGVLPVKNPQPTAMILTLLEAQALKGWVNDIIPNPWPSLSRTYAEAAEKV